jgi:hypothetical protein
VSRKKAEELGSMLPFPLQFLAAWLGVWFARAWQQQVDYLMAENQVLRERLGGRKLDLTDADRRRFVLSTKSECLERMVLLGERHLRWALSAYLRHYHRERNHQAGYLEAGTWPWECAKWGLA